MEIICTRPSCTQPRNFVSVGESELRTIKQRYCQTCGMELFLADRYLPLKLLGQGGFGTAFLAGDRYRPNLPPCVVKQFKPFDLDLQQRAIAKQLFEREAVVLADLGKHPQIPSLFAYFTPIVPNIQQTGDEQYFYLAQEFIDGQNLEQELEARGTFSEAEVREVLTKMLKILEFVHEHHIIHRDIKPSNIMRNKQGVLYLLDFGAVKQIAVGDSNQKTTSIYSPGYAPPEQVSGLQIYPSTDLYALAATCLNLLTGTPVEQLYNRESNTWRWYLIVNVSDRFKQIIARMLHPSPSERFQSAGMVLDALNRFDRNFIAIEARSDRLPRRKKRKKRPFSLAEILTSAGFTGFESSLVYLGITNWLSPSGESLSFIVAIIGGIVFVVYRRLIEGIDLAIIATISAIIVAFVPKFRGSLNPLTVVASAISSAVVAMVITVFFHWGHKLLSANSKQ